MPSGELEISSDLRIAPNRPLFPARSARRILVIGGILLILSGMIFGDIFAAFILHPNAALIGDNFAAATAAVSKGDARAVSAAFQNVGYLLENHGTKVDAHVHMIGFGYLALLLALLQPLLALGENAKERLAWIFLVGAVLLPVGVFLIHYVGLAGSPFTAVGWASIFADFGGLLVLLACIGEFAGFCLFLRRPAQAHPTDELSCDRSISARALLAGGCLLVLLGFLHGAWYAGFHLYANEAQNQSVIIAMASDAASGQPVTAQHDVAQYDEMQAAQAVNIAAHSHIIEFGILGILMGLLQPLVFLRERWKTTWAFLMLAGSFFLPFFVLMEIRWGLTAGGIADTAGLLVAIALFAMLVGVFRHTGRVDAGARV